VSLFGGRRRPDVSVLHWFTKKKEKRAVVLAFCDNVHQISAGEEVCWGL